MDGEALIPVYSVIAGYAGPLSLLSVSATDSRNRSAFQILGWNNWHNYAERCFKIRVNEQTEQNMENVLVAWYNEMVYQVNKRNGVHTLRSWESYSPRM